MSIVERSLSAAKRSANEEYYNNVIEFGIFCLSVCKDTLLEQIILELLPSIQRILYLSFTANENNLSEGALLLVKGATAINERAVEQTEILLRKWLSLEMALAINGLKAGHLLKH